MPIDFSDFLNQTSLGDYISIFATAGFFVQLTTIAQFGILLFFLFFLRKEEDKTHVVLIIVASIQKLHGALQDLYEAYVFQQGQEYSSDIFLIFLGLLSTAYFLWYIQTRKRK